MTQTSGAERARGPTPEEEGGGGQPCGSSSSSSTSGARNAPSVSRVGHLDSAGCRGRSSSMFPLEVSVSKKRMKKCLTVLTTPGRRRGASPLLQTSGGALGRLLVKDRSLQLDFRGGKFKSRGNTEVQHARIKTQLRVNSQYKYSHMVSCLYSPNCLK